MEPIKVVQLLNLNNRLNMKGGEIGLSAFCCHQHVIAIGFDRSANGPALKLVSANSWHLVPSTKKRIPKSTERGSNTRQPDLQSGILPLNYRCDPKPLGCRGWFDSI